MNYIAELFVYQDGVERLCATARGTTAYTARVKAFAAAADEFSHMPDGTKICAWLKVEERKTGIIVDHEDIHGTIQDGELEVKNGVR